VLLVVYWGGSPASSLPLMTPPTPSGLHCVLAIRHDGGRVFFKNPQYPGWGGPGTPGGSATNPPRRYEAIEEALESISDTDLQGWIRWTHAPTTGLI
jgi:hypothetical protein